MTGAVAFAGKNKTQVAFTSAGAGATTGGGAGSISVPAPATVNNGDLLLVHVVARDPTAASVGTPSGWTSIDSRSIGGTVASRLLFKVADGTEGGGSVGVSVADGTNAHGRMYRFTQGSANEGSGGQTNAASSTTIPQQSVTSTLALSLGVNCVFAQVSTTIGNFTGETGGDFTEAVAEYNATTCTMQIQTATMAAATTISGGSATLGAAGTNRIIHGTVLNP